MVLSIEQALGKYTKIQLGNCLGKQRWPIYVVPNVYKVRRRHYPHRAVNKKLKHVVQERVYLLPHSGINGIDCY